MVGTVPFERVGPLKYRIARHADMRVDAVFYASKEIMAGLEAEGFASLKQLINVACLPGIVAPALAMPDIHWGYGFPIGGVAAFDPEQGGVVSPGGVGYDINCGVRLLRSNLTAAAIETRKDAMAAAANFAFANRQRITASVRQAFEQVGFTPRDHGLEVVYDLAHNNAKLEEHGGKRVLVHRKGATRAFGPRHPELSERYRGVGQPVFDPGDMGRYSFVLVGTETAMGETFGSSCHGAGRKMSRRRAKKVARQRNLIQELAEQGIVVRAASRSTVDEEMPETYKDVADVVDVVHRSGIGKRVARLRPLVVVKG